MNDNDGAVQARLGGRDASVGSPTAALGSLRIPRSFKKDPAQHAAAECVRQWTRERFRLSEDDATLVMEVACALPGCPPLETVVAFWTEGDKRHHFKIFKPVAEVIPDDLPPTWMKNALVAGDGTDFDCC